MSPKPPFVLPPSIEDLEAIAAAAYAAIPRELTRHVDNVVIRVVDFPDEDTMDEMGCETEFDLLGLYRGVDLSRKSVADVVTNLDMVFLYRRPLLDYWCETGEDLHHLVRHVTIHELGHHLGLSDAEMEAIEAAADAEDRRRG